MPKHFTLRERYKLEMYYNELKLKPREIALKMDKHINTIYNELHRGITEQISSDLIRYKTYCADVAQAKYNYNATAKGAKIKIANDFDFANAIEDLIINKKYSPYAALVSCSKKAYKTKVCLRTLYNYIYKKVFYRLTSKDLPVGKKKKCKDVTVKRPHVANRLSIEDRPDISKRDMFGHWEMDTVVGKKGSKPVLLVLSERKTRLELIYKMPDKTCDSTWKVLQEVKNKLGSRFKEVFKSITVDNGVEFSNNSKVLENDKELNVFNRTNFYYCHPYCSNERGTNENQNKLIRRFIPKGVDIVNYSDKDIQRIQDWINNYPRKIFEGLSSFEYLEKVGIS